MPSRLDYGKFTADWLTFASALFFLVQPFRVQKRNREQNTGDLLVWFSSTIFLKTSELQKPIEETNAKCKQTYGKFCVFEPSRYNPPALTPNIRDTVQIFRQDKSHTVHESYDAYR